MAEKVTTMVLKVDLQCPCCSKKIKKILAKFPEIRSHIYDEKQNTVTITVVCCNPEKIRCKLLCKGGKTIKCIKIIEEPPKPQQGKPKKKADVDKDTNETTEKPVETAPPPNPTTPKKRPEQAPSNPVPANGYPLSYPIPVCCGPCHKGNLGGPCYHGYGRLVPIPVPVPIRVPVPIIPKWVPAHRCPPKNPVPDCCGPCSKGNPGGPCSPQKNPVPDCCGPCSEGNPREPCSSPKNLVPDCCGPCSEGNPGGPCYHGYGRQVPCYDGYWNGSGSGGCTSM